MWGMSTNTGALTMQHVHILKQEMWSITSNKHSGTTEDDKMGADEKKMNRNDTANNHDTNIQFLTDG